MRCVIYARFSSDMQSEQSIDDQVRVCRALAERNGWEVVEVYADYALSGASAARPRYQQMQADLRTGRFERVVAESLDRISRDQEHIAGFYKTARFAGVQIVTHSEGEISELHIGLKGTMSALFLKELGQKTHRGVEGVVRAGRSGGGLSFGYQVRRGFKSDGTPLTGELEIDQAQAPIVQRIFESYALGQSPKSIARALNMEGVPGPRGGSWTASLLLGGVARETGILRNRLYVGQRVWNRQRFLKDPATGRRVGRVNPEESWVVSEVPELAIVQRDVWDAAQARLAHGRRVSGSARNRGAGLAAARRPKWPLSGLIKCGVCKGPMSVMGAGGRLGCSNYVERRSCSNNRTVLRDRLQARVLTGLKERLLTPELVEEFTRSYVDEINAANRERGSDKARLEGQRAKLNRQVRYFLDLIKEGLGSAALVHELREVERQREDVERRIAEAGTPEAVPVLHPNLPEVYRRRVEGLEEALGQPEMLTGVAEVLRLLINAVEVFPGERRGEVEVSLRGDLAAFLHMAEAEAGRERRMAQNGKTPDITSDIRGLSRVMATWDAGTRKQLDLLLTA
jgi:DNA invertase Pin-like site-specific DNA recombinase